MAIADTRLGWRLVNPRMKDLHGLLSMGETAEEVAARYGVTRDRQDAFALRSHQLAAAARDAGASPTRSSRSAGPAARSPPTRASAPTPRSPSSAACKPVFRAGGTVTAGNSSPLNDGAAGAAAGQRGRRCASSAWSRWAATSPAPPPACTPT